MIVETFSRPATAKGISAKVVPILSEYFVSLSRTELAELVAELWIDELAEYPLWAVHNAARWWISKGNTNRRKKPLPGDISERCEVEMSLVRLAAQRVKSFDERGPATTDRDRAAVVLSDDERMRRAKVLAELQAELRAKPLMQEMTTIPKTPADHLKVD